jgi:hypothetical protein
MTLAGSKRGRRWKTRLRPFFCEVPSEQESANVGGGLGRNPIGVRNVPHGDVSVAAKIVEVCSGASRHGTPTSA